MTDGELWSWVRSVMAQGACIQQDYESGLVHKSYEAYSARLDAAAAERAEELAVLRGDWLPLVQAFADAAIAAERERCKRAVRDTADRSGVNDDGRSWLMRATREDFIAAIDA